MKSLFALLGLLAFIVCAPVARSEDAAEVAIHETITRQLDAISKDDASTAFGIASPNIQTMFGDAAVFMSMVQRGYPQIYRSIGHKFLNIDTTAGKLMQRVLIESDKGSVIVRYEMIELDGHWRINGCLIEKQEAA